MLVDPSFHRGAHLSLIKDSCRVCRNSRPWLLARSRVAYVDGHVPPGDAGGTGFNRPLSLELRLGATRRSTGRSRHRSILPSNPELAPKRVWVGRRGDQQPRVLVAWSLRQLFGRPTLDDLAA